MRSVPLTPGLGRRALGSEDWTPVPYDPALAPQGTPEKPQPAFVPAAPPGKNLTWYAVGTVAAGAIALAFLR